MTHLNKQYKWQQWCTSITRVVLMWHHLSNLLKGVDFSFCIFRKEDRYHIREQRLLCQRFVTWRFQPENVPSNLTEQYITSLKWKLDCQMKYLSVKYRTILQGVDFTNYFFQSILHVTIPETMRLLDFQ